MKKIFLLICCCVGILPALFAQNRGVDMAVLNRIMRYKMDGLIPLRSINAAEGKPVDGARVAVNGIGTFTSDLQGIITFPEQEDGFYTLEFSKQGYISSKVEFEVKLNNVLPIPFLFPL